MSSIKAFQYRLRCKPAQHRLLQRWAGGLRWVWNQALAEQRARHTRGEKYVGYVQMCQWLTAWRNAAETAWLADGPAHPQQQVLKRLDEAYKRFFAKSGGAPAFKRRGDEPGMRFPDAKQFELDQLNETIRLPKLGWTRLRLSRPVTGEIRNLSLRQIGGHWHVAIQTRSTDALQTGLAPSLGIDLGLSAFAATSQGEIVPPLQAMARQQCRLRRYQRSVSRKKKGSVNRGKALARLGQLHRRIARQRNDWLHQLSTELADRHPVIAIEDLRVSAMSASAKRTVNRPGRNVKAKAGLNRSIQDAAWAEFRRLLEYKVASRGGQVIAVDPAYTSQRCSCCGHVDRDNRKTQSAFICLACGHAEHADVNAAKNILAAGHAVWSERTAACGEAVRHGRRASAGRAASAKQEPSEETCHA